ncbi:MAG TPA: LysR family transcriptional regulator, partial [Rhizobacter sp.]|nr:LysR family transcriptional regulator [Rhizobacter sp.]
MTMKNLTLRQLRAFEAAAASLSFSRAAEQLSLTQPAISMQIRLLEDDVGLPLFRKQGR